MHKHIPTYVLNRLILNYEYAQQYLADEQTTTSNATGDKNYGHKNYNSYLRTRKTVPNNMQQ
jgi:hypothetical protein